VAREKKRRPYDPYAKGRKHKRKGKEERIAAEVRRSAVRYRKKKKRDQGLSARGTLFIHGRGDRGGKRRKERRNRNSRGQKTPQCAKDTGEGKKRPLEKRLQRGGKRPWVAGGLLGKKKNTGASPLKEKFSE